MAVGVISSFSVSGCVEMSRGVETAGGIGQSVPAEGAEALSSANTVRSRGALRAPATDTSVRESEAVPAVVASAVPSPRQIFDFHPPGSRPDSWRQPFIIEANDGPLAADVRRSQAELKAYNDQLKAGRSVALNLHCSEVDVAQDKRGCVGSKPKVVLTTNHDPLAIR